MTGQGVRTTCPYCGVGCGVIVSRDAMGKVEIKGDPDHPANFGRLCSKGLALGETLGLEQRQLVPMVDGSVASWDQAIQTVAQKFSDTIATHGRESVALYVSGQLLTEDYYVANKMMKGYIGTANIDTNSRLCMASAVAGHKRAFGADVVPCSYSDLEAADLIVLVGSNLAWCHPVLFQRIQAEREKRELKLVVIDPRRTATAEAADLHLAIAPQTDVALFNGLLTRLNAIGEIDEQFVISHTTNLAEALQVAEHWIVERVAETTGLPLQDVELFYRLFASHAQTVTCFSMGVNQSTSGTDKVNSIINCHLLTGRIGKAGAGPFSLTGQPNAMGGREVGGLANMLAAHMDIENNEHRKALQDFWGAPHIAQKPGLKAVDLFRAIDDGRIKALWIISTNPAVSMPDAAFVKAALKKCPFVVVSDVTRTTETADFADVFLPAAGWGEKNGTVTNSERRMSRQRAFLPPPGDARADWKAICDVAKAMGFSGFDFETPADVFREHAALTAVANDGARAFDISNLSALSCQDYDCMEPTQWGGTHPHAERHFQTFDGKAKFVATDYIADKPLSAVQFRLNTGRIRDQWHTMTRTGLAPRLMQNQGEPFVELHPSDALKLGIAAADLVFVTRGDSTNLVRALITDATQAAAVFQPMHWSAPFASAAAVNSNIDSQTDRISGQPALKSGAVQLRKFEAAWQAFGMSLHAPTLDAAYWSCKPVEHGFAFECAGLTMPDNWLSFVQTLFAAEQPYELVSVVPSQQAFGRWVLRREGKVIGALFMNREPVEVARAWVISQLNSATNPIAVLRGRPSAEEPDAGPILCACMAVGRNTIVRHAAQNPQQSLATLCETSRAGTGCGTCRSEVHNILKAASNTPVQHAS